MNIASSADARKPSREEICLVVSHLRDRGISLLFNASNGVQHIIPEDQAELAAANPAAYDAILCGVTIEDLMAFHAQDWAAICNNCGEQANNNTTPIEFVNAGRRKLCSKCGGR